MWYHYRRDVVLASTHLIGGANSGGTLILTCNRALTYSPDSTYCDSSAVSTCDQAVVTSSIDNPTTVIFHVLAAFPENSSPRMNAVSFGVDYDGQRMWILGSGHCGSWELHTGGWPGPGTGTAITFNDPRTALLDEVYWFAAYVYAESTDSLRFSLTSHGTYGGEFADDSVPSARDSIADYGKLGFNMAGKLPCPASGEDTQDGEGEGQFGQNDYDQDDGQQVDGCVGIENPINKVLVYLAPGAVDFEPSLTDPVAIESIDFQQSGLQATLLDLGAQTMRKDFPGTTLADTAGTDVWGQSIKLPDVSGFYEIAFPDTASACAAVSALKQTAGVRCAQIRTADTLRVSDFPNDPQFYSWRSDGTNDPQWQFRNRGLHVQEGCNPPCPHAQSGNDIDIEPAWFTFGDPYVTIGLLDLGVQGGMDYADSTHPDLPGLIPLTSGERSRIQKHPDLNWCRPHGTEMAGVAGAKTNNDLGVAGVCGDCSLLDIEQANCTHTECQSHNGLNTCYDIDQYYYDAIEPAANIAESKGKSLQAVLLSYAKKGMNAHQSLDGVTALYRAYLQHNLALVAPTADHINAPPSTVYPANIPFVFGVGGSNWAGQFWDQSTSCYWCGDDTLLATAIGQSSGR